VLQQHQGHKLQQRWKQLTAATGSGNFSISLATPAQCTSAETLVGGSSISRFLIHRQHLMQH
jgi:hypothetical protein